jgi:hypothetical protein
MTASVPRTNPSAEQNLVHDRVMRWLLALIVVMTVVDTADARRLVISEPPMVRRCPKFRAWNQVMTCLNQHYTAKLTKEVKGAKLVTLFTKNTPAVDSGVLLYIERGGNWQLGGRYETYGGEYSVLGLAPVTIGKRSGYRLDLGQVTPVSLMVDATASVMATQRLHRAMFCTGDSYHCPEATVACDVLVEGNAWHVFRGTLSYEENIVNVAGDRDHAGPYCNVSPKTYLGWVTK